MVAYSFKKRFIGPIRIGLGFPTPDLSRYNQVATIEHGILPKRQTIRAVGKRRHARPGDTLQLYTGMRTRQCKKIGEARCVSVDPIEIMVDSFSIFPEVNGKNIGVGIDEFAQQDGFLQAHDMHQFWLKEHGPGLFKGLLIKWETIR